MKTFTKHILLLALMLFGVAGAAWATRAPQKWTTQVNITQVIIGDTLAPGFSLTSDGMEKYVHCDEYRYAMDGVVQDNQTDFTPGEVTSFADGNFLVWGITITPVLEDQTTAGNAWVVTNAYSTFEGYEIHLSGISITPDPTVPALDELTGNWNFLMPGSNKVVKVTYKAEPALAWTFGNRAIPNDTTITAYRGFELPVISSIGAIMNHDFYTALLGGTVSLRYGSTNPAVISFTNPNNMYSFSVNGAGECDVYMVFDGNDDFQDDSVAFHAVIANPATLTLNPSAGGTLEIAESIGTVYTFTFEHVGSPEDSRAITIPASRFPYDTTFSYNANFTFVDAYDQMHESVSIFAQGDNWVTVRISGPFQYGGYYSCEFEGGATDDWSISCSAGTGPVPPDGVIAGTAENTYLVLPGTEVNVTATPDSAHYLSRIDGHDTVSNYACGYSFVMPSSDKDLLAVFNDKPTLTLAQTDGGTLEAIGSGDATIWNSETWNGWTNSENEHTVGDITLQTTGFAYDYNGNLDFFVSVYDDNKTVTFSTTGDNFTRIELTMTSGATFGDYGQPNILPADGWTVTEGDNVAVWEGNAASITMSSCSTAVSQIAFYRGTGTSNVIASSTPNTYYIDYGTPVTVVATPDAQHYLVSFSDDDPATELNSNFAVEKTYDSVIAPIDLSANFQAKPTLTLTANDGGTLTVEGAGSAGGEVTIGNGTETTSVTPYNSLWEYSFVESLYTAEEIGTAGTITSVSYHLRENDEPQTSDFVIYMKNVSRSTFASGTDYEPVTDADIVYSGSVTFNPGWTTITLGTPFEYDGTSNLMIAFDENIPGFITRYFYYTDNAGKVVSYHADNYNPDPYNLGSYAGNKTVSSNRANIKLDIAPAATAIVALSDTTYRVDYGTDVTVVATPDSIHYLATLGEELVNSNDSIHRTFTMTAPVNLPADFRAKPTLTLAQTEGGTLEAIVPQGGAIVENVTADMVSNGWQGNYDAKVTEADLQAYGFMAVDEAAAAAWTGAPAFGDALLIYGFTTEGKVKLLEFHDGINYGTTLAFYNRGYIYNIYNLVYFTTGTGTANVIASTTPNTYIIDYGTDVTVKATPDATHYLANFDGTDVRNDNDTATKTYTNITAPFTSTATFQAKPTLALTSNEGGEMSLPGYTPSSFTPSTIDVISWDGVNAWVMDEDMPTDFTPLSQAEILNWQSGIEGNYIVFYRIQATNSRAVFAKFVDGAYIGSYYIRKQSVINDYLNQGYQVLYTNNYSPAVFPEGVVAANNTLDTFVVNYGANVTVKATPSDTAYLVRFDQDADTNSNVAVEKTYGPLTAALTTAEATFNAKPVLTLAQNESWGSVTIEGAGSAGGAGEEVTIGNGTSTTYYGPYNSLWGYSFVESLYTAEEIGTSGTITSISYNLKEDNQPQTNNITVYMKNVSRSTFASSTDFEPVTEADIVYSGSVTFNPGWSTITLDTPFEYDGTSTLMVGIHEFTPGYSTRYFYYTSSSTAKLISGHSDSDNPNPLDMSSYSGNKYTQNLNINIKLGITPAATAIVALSDTTYRVDYGTTVKVIADATELHHVKNWVDADSVAYPADSITYSDYAITTPQNLFPAKSAVTLTVTGDTMTKAIFGINSYDVFARVDTTEDVRGTVRAEYIDIDGVSQSVAADDTVTYTAQGGNLSLVIAIPTEPGYHFERWTDTLGTELGTNDTLEVTEAAAVIAVFDTNVYQISGTVAEGSEEWGEVTGSGDYRHFTQATLEAQPIEHYHFVRWEDGNTENPRVIDVVGPESHQAEFAIDRFIVSWSSNDEAMGHVVGPYDNHTTGAPIPRLRGVWGTTFQLVAQPAEHHMLDHWSTGATTNGITVTITENAEIVAYFKHVPYIVTVLSEDETMGTVAGTDTLEWQESTEISATANYGYHFTMWNDGVTDNPRTVVNNIESDQTFTASFAKNEYTVTVVSADETMGSVAGTDTVEYLDEIEISATANEHYHFVQWNDGETANPRTVSVTKNETYTATFAPNVYTLTLGINNAIMGTVALTAPAVTPNADGSYSIAYGTAVTVKGSASSRCFELGSWSDGAVVTADGSHSFSMAGNLVLTATFVNHLFRSDTVADVCDRFVWHGIAYTETPDVAPLHRLTTVDGCDSALVLNLTVRHSSTGVDEQVHCTPYTWIDGVTYSESNHTAQYILPGANAEQCDSIVTLDLTIGTQAESTEVVNACDSYEWHGVVYTETPAEAPTYTYHTLEGCDSTVTLQLTIGHPTEDIETIVACAPIEWHGTVYSESTDEPTWHTTNAAGCDSTVTLHLTIAPAIETEETVEACDEYEWHGVVYTETPAEAPTYTTVSVQGCDSTVTLHLTVNHSTAAVETVVACNSYEWHGVSYASSTTVPTYTTTGSNGCDSTTTLHLTINRSTSAVETVEACDSYEWHGTTYTVSTSLPTYTTEGSNGCDSTTTLNLTIKQSSRATETVVTCDEYEWHGVLFTETPVEAPTYTTEGSNGCDSTVTLNLTVNHSADVVETIGACAAIEWHGTVYSESTTEPTWHSTTVAGCDSTVTLHLTISDRIETEETVVACDSYEWHGVVYTASTDNATWSTTSIQGCDSTVTLHLTINRSTTGSETIEACESYEWHGVTYRQSGSYTFDTLNVAGCDSTVTLTLTLHQPTSGSEFVTTCGSYVWHEVTYTQSGAYVWHGTDVHGCDSTVTLLLTILQPVYSTENRTACNSYTWHGTEYSESGDYTWSTTAVSGCDSIVTLHLTINLPVTSDVEESACERYSWNGIVYSTSGDYVQTFTGVNGCDSTVTLHLTVNMPATETLGVTACDSYEWHEVTYTESGVYSWHGTTVAGCDSTATLNLTIGHSADTTISLQGEGSIVWNGETFTQSGTYERVIRTVLGCDSTVTLNLVILPEGFVMPYLYNIMDVVLTINHFQQGETNLQYHWYRWYRNGKMVAEGRAMDTYSEGGSKLNGVYYLEVAIDESLEYWVRSNEVTIGTVGIDEAEDIDFTVAPNPVMHGSTVSVAVEGADVQGAVISVYDVQGREVLRQQNSAFIEAPAASGMYMVRLTLNDGRTAVKRLIVK